MSTRKDKPSSTELEQLLHAVLAHARLTRRALANKSGMAPETLSRISRRGTADFSTVARLVKSAGMKLVVLPQSDADQSHRRLDARSLALHAVIAGKLSADPSLIEHKVLPNIARFKRIHAGTGTERLLEEWEKASRKGLSALVRLCIEPTDRGQQLRQTSPLTGILTPQERKRIYDAYAT